jgi:peptidoglycan hydrolase-like protein with peptidoglycan-binding domain
MAYAYELEPQTGSPPVPSPAVAAPAPAPQQDGPVPSTPVSTLPAQAAGAGAAPAPAHTALTVGSHGQQVIEAQHKLNLVPSTPAPLVEDGQYGPITSAAVSAFQIARGAVATGLLDLATWALLDTAAAAAAVPVRAVLTPGMSHPDVGFCQQKLNALGARPRLSIDAQYGPPMNMPVMLFELFYVHRLPTGVIDAPAWAALDAAVAGGFVLPEGGVPVEQHTDNAAGATSLGTQRAGTSLHPVVGAGGLLDGPAVQELQQKLNTAGAAPALVVDGRFGPLTTAAVRAFQSGQVPALPATGVADAATWTALDAVAPTSTVGFVSRQWNEEVGGHQYGLTSLYSWEILPTKVQVTVEVNFTGLPAPAAWFSHVTSAWNKYKAVRDSPADSRDIDFRMVRGGGGDAMTVNVVGGTGRANAGTWFAADPNASATVPHEFGHLIGLADEYQQHPGDYQTVTGHEPPVGDAAGPPGMVPATVAGQLQTAMVARNDVAANTATVGAGLRPGAFAQRIVDTYATLPTVTVPAVLGSVGPPPVPAQPAVPLTGNLVRDLDSALPDTTPRYDTIQVLTYTSGSLMGDPSRVQDPHDHGTQPRHVQQFVDILAAALGGTWRAVAR